MGTELDDPNARDNGPQQPRAAVPVLPPSFSGSGESPTETLVAGTVGDRCVNCGAPLTPDQRYCINCGERRGAARFTLPAATPESPPPAPSRRERARRARPSQGATLVAGIGTLLLAMGVGVLIGHGSAGTKTVQSPRSQVITVNAGGGGGGASGGAATTATSHSSTSAKGSKQSKKSSGGGSKSKSSHKASASAPATPPKPTKQEAAAAQSAANKVTGGSDVNNAPVTVTTGQSCTGEGCQNGKFTGNFFGGG